MLDSYLFWSILTLIPFNMLQEKKIKENFSVTLEQENRDTIFLNA